MGDKTKGLIGKFRVTRSDGRDRRGAKHFGCSYFVLDLTHDKHAKPALEAYARSARADGYVPLADDLDKIASSLGESGYFDNAGAAIASARIYKCTGVAARWCPVHGDCTCGAQLTDAQCPLHGKESTHAEAE